MTAEFKQVDAWTRLIWLYGEGRSGTDLGFRYRKQGDTPWITVPGDKVEVSSPQVSSPVAVRYGWDKFFRVNLYNREGLPATPFRTDDWKL